MTFRQTLLTATFAGTLAFAGMLPAHASDVTKHQKIEELFQLLQINRSIDQISAQQVVQAKQIMKTMIPAGSMTPDQQKDMDDFLAKILTITHEAVNWPKLEPQFVDLYAATYSEEEIDGILAFYRSPTGQVMIAKQPDLLAKSQTISQTQLLAIQPKLMQAVQQFAQEMVSKHGKQ